MASDAIFRETMRDYERDRDAAAKLSDKRRNDIYNLIPRIDEIDKELSKTGRVLARRLLSQTSDFQSEFLDFQANNMELQTERKLLLEQAGFAPDYIENTYKCCLCKDTGFIDNRSRCKCLLQRLILKRYAQSNLKNILEKENFDTFNINYYSEEVNSQEGISPKSNIKLVLNRCLAFVAEFNKAFSNLLLFGKPGLGKTFLCNCIAKELLDNGHSVLYTTAPQLFKKMEDFRFNRSEVDDDEPESYTDFILNSDLLIIDDLGTEFVSVVTSSELFNFINTRYLNQKPTIISTNMSIQDLNEHYSERITSRITGNYQMLKLFGDDIRTAKKYK